MLGKDYFKELAKDHYGIKVERVSYGDVMFAIEQEKYAIDIKIAAQEEMLVEYMNKGEEDLATFSQGKIHAYQDRKEALEKMQNTIYKKVL